MLYGRHLFVLVEPLLLAAALVLFALRSALLVDLGTRCGNWWRGLVTRCGGHLVAAMFLLGSATSASVSLLAGAPVPRVQDEFSYVLAGETLASFHLALPSPPAWEHFETFHVLVHPVYASKYPPAQGLLLAVGWLVGHGAIGLYLGAGLLCAAITWMLLAFLPRAWAALGGLLVLLRIAFASYWSHTYWGGGVAAIGGALVFGALRRLDGEQPRARHALLLASGVAILANSRPFEGAVAAAVPAILLVVWMVRRRWPWQTLLARVILPIGLVLALAIAAMATYNQRLTGDPLLLPYQLWEETYARVPSFSGRDFRTDTRGPASVVAFYDALAETYDPAARWIGPARAWERISFAVSFFCGLTMAPLLLVGLLARRQDRWPRIAAGVIALVLAAELFIRPWWPHYVAPVTGLFFLVATTGLERLWHWRRGGQPLGPAAVLLVVAIQVGLVLPQLSERLRERGFWSHRRAGIERTLERRAGRDLVLVRYGAAHHPAREWVYNRADIENAPVLWAHDLGEEANRGLLQAFPGRHAWLLEVDGLEAPQPRLSPYRP